MPNFAYVTNDLRGKLAHLIRPYVADVDVVLSQVCPLLDNEIHKLVNREVAKVTDIPRGWNDNAES